MAGSADSVCWEIEGTLLMNVTPVVGNGLARHLYPLSQQLTQKAEGAHGEAGWLAGKLGMVDGSDRLSSGSFLSTMPSDSGLSADYFLRRVPQSVRSLDSIAFDRAVSFSSHAERNETEFSLELRTREGDVVSLGFRQLDFRSEAEGDGASIVEQGLERVVNMSVTGDLSDPELAAIDRMLVQVAEQASSFFEGDLSTTAARLASLDFDSDQLVSFALDFTRTSHRQLMQVFGDPGRGLGDLARRDTGVASLLESLANTQRQLMEEAMALFDAPGAAHLSRKLVSDVFAFTGLQGQRST